MADLISSTGAIGPGSLVTLHFTLLLADVPAGADARIDGTDDGSPASFAIGDGSLLPGFEAPLLGLRVGAEETFRIAAEDAFGEPQAGNVRTLPRADFTQMDLEPGLLVSFASPDGELPGLVRELTDETVTVDFNHPLAGRPIDFMVRILKVEPPPVSAA
ncbi:MAG: peptidylprolyl isomerase [Pseudomonadota bacterium]